MSAIIAPQVITLQIPGTLSTSSVVSAVMPFKGVVVDAYVAVTTAPVGSALQAELLVGSDVAAAFSIAAAGTSDQGTLTAANVDFAKGAIVSLDVTQVGSGTAGANAVVTIVVAEVSESTKTADDSFNG
jgi:hypothetical protein